MVSLHHFCFVFLELLRDFYFLYLDKAPFWQTGAQSNELPAAPHLDHGVSQPPVFGCVSYLCCATHSVKVLVSWVLRCISWAGIAELCLGMERESESHRGVVPYDRAASMQHPWHLIKHTTGKSALHIVSACQQRAGSYTDCPDPESILSSVIR